MTASGFDLTVKNFWVGRTFDLQDANQPPFGARQSVIDQDVVARHLQLEFRDDGCKIACNVDPLRGLFASNSDPL